MIRPLVLMALALLLCTAVLPGPPAHASGGDSLEVSIIQARQGDTWESLAAEHLGDASLAPVLREHNPFTAPVAGNPVVIPLNAYTGPRITAEGHQTVPILLYHQFSRDTTTRMIASAENFAAQMQLLADEGYTVIPLADFFDFVAGRRTLPPKSVILTFDDGWQSFYDIAFPILQQHGYPATLFVYTDLIVGSDITLSWDQIREMAAAGLDIQCHSRTHRDLSAPAEGETLEAYMAALEEETAGAAALIAEKTGIRPKYFAYPYGYASPVIEAVLKAHGFDAALTAIREPNPFYIDPFYVSRSMVYGGWDIDAFREQLVIWSGGDAQ